jgi:hypothetical protein
LLRTERFLHLINFDVNLFTAMRLDLRRKRHIKSKLFSQINKLNVYVKASQPYSNEKACQP